MLSQMSDWSPELNYSQENPPTSYNDNNNGKHNKYSLSLSLSVLSSVSQFCCFEFCSLIRKFAFVVVVVLSSSMSMFYVVSDRQIKKEKEPS